MGLVGWLCPLVPAYRLPTLFSFLHPLEHPKALSNHKKVAFLPAFVLLHPIALGFAQLERQPKLVLLMGLE